MKNNYSKKSNQKEEKEKDIEERVQIAKETCNSEEEIAAAIERSKQKLKSSEAPLGYSKIDEQITTIIYKVPDNENNNNVNFKLEYVCSPNQKNMKYVENYENNYNYNNKKPKTFTKNIPYKGGRIENYYENNFSNDGQYLVTISLSKIVNDSAPQGHNDIKTNITKQINNNNKTNNINKASNINYNNNNYNKNYNYKKEKIETTTNNKEVKKVNDINEKSSKIQSKEERFGHNYNFYERKENISASKVSQIHQRMREPIQIQKNQKHTVKTQINIYNKELPEKEVKTVIKNYKKEIKGNDDNKNVGKYSNLKVSSNNVTTTNSTTKQINNSYKNEGKN